MILLSGLSKLGVHFQNSSSFPLLDFQNEIVIPLISKKKKSFSYNLLLTSTYYTMTLCGIYVEPSPLLETIHGIYLALHYI